MLIITLLLNLLMVLIESRKRFRGGGGRAAGIGKVTQTFGKGVATLIKDIKQGNFGDDEQYSQYDTGRQNRFVNGSTKAKQEGSNPLFYVAVFVTAIIIVILGILIQHKLKQRQEQQQGKAVENMKKRHNERYKHYDAVKMIAQDGIHPDKAFGRLQKISYRQKKRE